MMSNVVRQEAVSRQIRKSVPFLRRYARALTGSRESGDRYALAALESLLSEGSLDPDQDGKLLLFRAFHVIWATTGMPVGRARTEDPLERRAYEHLATLTPNTREVLLLHTIEEFPVSDVAHIVDLSQSETSALLDIAFREMAAHGAGRILIIEDESIIAIDLQNIVGEMGHAVTGIATTREKAKELAKRNDFHLILSDIQLADGSNGLDAVADIIAAHGPKPVIYITAFPERLLQGNQSEPAFMISKPYSEEQVRAAVSQAMFFSDIRTLQET